MRTEMKVKNRMVRPQERRGSSPADSRSCSRSKSRSSSPAESRSRSRKQPVGLFNLGNTCYLNSVLQCLTYTPPFAQFCLTKQHSSSCNTSSSDCPFCLVEQRIVRSRNIVASVDTPYQIKNSLHVFAKHFVNGRQEDAHEFLTYLLGACNNVCLEMWKEQNGDEEAGKNEPNTIIKDIFGGVLQSQVKCLSCRAESNKHDDIMDLSLEILEDVTSLQEALSCYFASQVLDGDNMYSCDNCKTLTKARKQMSIFRPPNVLVIQLKRFLSGPSGGKITRKISFTTRFQLGEYMSPAAESSKEYIRADHHSRPDYSLFATIIHTGFSQDHGHYYAYVKDESENWFCCNDFNVSPVSEEEVLSDEQVYLLFFKRRQRHVSRFEMRNRSQDDQVDFNVGVNAKVRTASDRSNDGEIDEENGERPSKLQKCAEL